MSEEGFNSWAIVEIMGHVTIAGRVSEQVIAGQTFVRVDVPEVEGELGFTRFYGPGSVYSITPCTEELASRAATQLRQRPITVYGVIPLSPLLSAPEEVSEPLPGFVEETEIPF